MWLFVGFVFAFGGLIGSLWVFIQEFLVKGEPIGLINYKGISARLFEHIATKLILD